MPTMSDTTKDCFGNEVRVGDTVIISPLHYRGLILAKVISVAPKSAVVEYQDQSYAEEYLIQHRQYSYEFAKWQYKGNSKHFNIAKESKE
jgi:hypothetical protein